MGKAIFSKPIDSPEQIKMCLNCKRVVCSGYINRWCSSKHYAELPEPGTVERSVVDMLDSGMKRAEIKKKLGLSSYAYSKIIAKLRNS